MTISDYAREKTEAAYAACTHIRAGICRTCARQLVVSACTDQKRGAVQALERFGNDGMDGELELIYKTNVWSLIMSSDPIAEPISSSKPQAEGSNED